MVNEFFRFAGTLVSNAQSDIDKEDFHGVRQAVDLVETELLPAAQRMALVYLARAERAKLEPAFALDMRLARIVSGTSEPMLGQMRLAWWRDVLSKPIVERPGGDGVVAAIGKEWAGNETALLTLVDAWEEMLARDKLDHATAGRIVDGRAGIIAETMRAPGGYGDSAHAMALGKQWALADLVAHFSSAEERQVLMALAEDLSVKRHRLPRNLRGISVLNALARHALKRGGRPLGEGRSSALIALRAGLIGR